MARGALEVGPALLLAIIAFVVFKRIGLVFKFALIAALAGLVLALPLAGRRAGRCNPRALAPNIWQMC